MDWPASVKEFALGLIRSAFHSPASCPKSDFSSPSLALPVLALLLICATASAATITVTRFDDTAANGPNTGDGLGLGASGDLRSAILAANAAGGTNIIDFSCASAPCTITLSGPLPPIFATPGGIGSYNLTIDGGQFGTVIIDGASQYRVFFVDNVKVTLQNLQIQNASATGGAGGNGAGGGGAGFGAGLFVNQATAVVTLSNIYFSNCSVTGGAGGAGIAGSPIGGPGGSGGGGGLGFAGAQGGGGGVTGPGTGNAGGSGGGGGPGNGTGGSAYADNNSGTNGANGEGGNGGFGGGGGAVGGNGGFGGGGAGGQVGSGRMGGFGGGGGGGSGNSSGGTSPLVGGISGGSGGAGSGYDNTLDPEEFPDGGGGGGAAAGPAIFVNLGTVTLDNVSGAGFSATGGTGGSGATNGCCSATNGGNGGASSVPVFNYGGTVNGSTTVGPVAGALPGGAAVPGTTPASMNFGSVAVGSSVTQPVFFTVASGTVVGSINVLTQGATGLDFTQAADTTCTATTYAAVTNCTVNVQFSPKYAGLRMGAVVFKNGSTVLATTYIYGIGTGPQLAFSPSTTTSLGSGFSNPVNVAVDGSGNIYVVDTPISAVKEMPPGCASSSCVTTLGGGFSSPFGVAVDGAGNVYVADSGHQAVKEMPPGCASATCVTTLGGSFVYPSDVALDGAGNVYVGDYYVVKEIPPGCTSATCVTTLGGGFGQPFDVAVDATGNVYVTDKPKQLLDEITPGCASSACVTPLGSGGLQAPQGVAVDASGNAYVTDTDNTVKKLTPGCASSSCVTTLSGGFNQPSGIALDGSGNIYVANSITSGTVSELNVTTPPSLSFGSSEVGVQSTSSPQTATVRNIGNAALTFPVPGTGTDPSVAANFTLDSSTTCPEVTTSSSAGILAAGATCNLAVDFIPTSGTSITGSVVLTDNNLNVTGATQSIGLSGTGIQPLVATSVVVTGYPSPVYVGLAHTGTVTVDDQNGNLLSTYSGSATIITTDNAATVTTPVPITNGTGTFTVTFSTTGTNQTITAAIPGPISGSQTGIVVNPFPDYVVTTATDDASGVATNCPAGGGGADCSLRDALAAAAAAGEGKITFSPSVFTAPTTINLGKGLTIPANTLVQGITSGSGYTLTNLITLSGIEVDSFTGGAFNVSSGVTGASIANLTIQNTNGEANIVNAGTLAVSGSTVTVTNNAYATRGIYNSGTMTLTDSTVSDNLTGPAGNGYGAGIYNSGSLTIVYSTISGNENASGNYAYGGGIYTTGTLRVESSTIVNNLAFGAAAFGGGIDIGGGSATINNSIVTGNTGGNIYGSYGGSGNQSATLSALGNYGGPTKTMLPEPGSASICGGFQANIPNQVTLDQRGLPNTNSTYAPYNSSSPCVDTGAVQTNYSLIFSTEPQPISPASLIFPSTNFEAAVTLDESGAPFTAAAETIPLALSATTGSLTGGSASTSTTTGIATYSTLQVSATGTADSLTASLTLNPAAGTPPSVSAVSNSFTVSPSPVATSLVVTGYPSPVYAGVAHTGTVTVDDQYGNPLTTYSGSATITTSDTAATMTTPVTIANGTGTFTVTFATTGTQSITAAIQGLTSVAQTGIQVNATPGFVVTTTADDATGAAANCPGNSCTLRDAITAAKAAGTGNITFSPAVFKSTNSTTQNTITLLTPLPALSGLLTIQGLGASIVTVSGNNSSTVGSIFIVNAGATVSISGLTIANGNAGGPLGGGIYSAGALTVAGCVFSGNTAIGGGGAIFVTAGSLVVQNSTFSSNSASASGGGAIWAAGDSANVSYSTFYNNTTDGATGSGGAIASFRPLTVSDSTFSSNSAREGGAIYGGPSTTVVNSIFAGNSARVSSGAAIFSDEVLNASNNVYYQNFDSGTTNEDDCYACTSNTGAISGNPSLAPLGNYGGPTPTMIPLPGSAAICAASSALIPNGAITDQRGDPNSTTYNSNKCYDVGAVQTSYSLIFSTEPQPISPASLIFPSTNFEAGVTLEESGAPFIGHAVTIPLTLSAGTGSLTGGSATTSTTTGIATYSTLQVNSTGTADTLTASLTLNPAAGTPPSVSAVSNSFTVSPSPVATSLVVTGYPSPVYVGLAHTGTVTVDDQYGNPLTTYSGSATITTSDTAATVTTPVTIANGTGTFTVTFATTGTQSITAAIQGLTSVAQTGIQVNATPGFVVTTTADDATGAAANCPGTSCTLRDAITAADAAGTGNITFSPTVFASTNTTTQNTITLLTPLPRLNGLINIQGLGASIVTVSGNNSATVGSIFFVNAGATVSISALTISNGKASSYGGGIESAGALTVTSCVFSGNSAVGGGAIFVTAGSLAVQNSTFSSNSATGEGGGAILANSVSVNISYSTFYNNTTDGSTGSGGAITSFGPLTVSDSTFSSNSSGYGGAIYASFSATVVNSIFAGNSAGASRGAAIFSAEVFNASNNLYYQNFDSGTTNEDDCHACTSNTGAISGNPSLAPLGNYGGPTPTMIPLPGSAAICTASSALIPNGVTTDQRGLPRTNTSYPAYTTNACIDLGAVQTNYSLIFSTEPQPISPATSIVAGTDFETAVTLDESGAPFIGPSVTIPMGFTGAGVLAGGSATTSTTTGIATYNGLTVSSADTGDTLTAYLVLNSAISTQPAISVKSSQFTVSPATVQVSVGTNIAGLSFTVDSTTSTSTQTPIWSIPSQHTIATTSPQYLGGIEYTLSSWSDGGAISHQVTASSGTTLYTATFAIADYDLTVTAGANGTIAASTAANGYYAPQSPQTISAIPNPGYYFVNWTGAHAPGDLASSTSATTTVTMNAPETLTANFAPIPGYVVTSTADDATGNAANCPGTGSSCTLRDAITAADANSGGAGTITFSPAVFKPTNTTAQNTITLLTPLPTLNGLIAIQGLGANLITVSGNKSLTVGSIFVVHYTATVAISGLTIANGNGISSVNGGGINSAGALTVANCVFSGNTAVAGGAINIVAGSLIVQNSTFSSNSATNAGGGAIYAGGDSANVSYSTFYNNISGGAGGFGGAIVSYGPLTVSDSTFSSNSASLSYGGAIESGYPATVVNSIFSGNSAAAGAGMAVYGLTSGSNLFYQNYDTGTTTEDDCNGCTSTNAISGNPNLAPLGNYGGSTPTMIPLPASAAICAASSAPIPNGVTSDQRGYPNSTTYNTTTCYDVGAVQTDYALSFTTNPPATGTVTNTAMFPPPTVTVTESDLPFIGEAVSLSLTDANKELTSTPETGATSATNGQAAFSNLLFTAPTTGDSLTATLVLNPNLPAINLATTTANTFSVTGQALSVTCSTTSLGMINAPFSSGPETVSGGTLPYTFSITGSLPAGLFLNSATGAITDTPTAPGTFGIAVADKASTAGATCPFTIQTTQTILLGGLPPFATYGSAGPYTLTASGGASGNPVTLSVTGPATLNGLVLTITGAGDVTVTANQAGSGIYVAAAPVSITTIVNPKPQTITFTGLPSQIAYGYGGPYTLTATGGGSTNPVTFSVTGPATLNGSTLTITGVGTVVVTAKQLGTTNYAPAAPVSQTISVVNQLTPVVAWATPAPITYGTALSGVQLNATANVPGTFSYLPCAGTVLSTGPQVDIATFTPANNLLGQYAIVTVQVTIQVNPAGSTPIVPYMQDLQSDGGAWQNVFSLTANYNDTVNLGPQPASGGKWEWAGPNGFTSKTRAINAVALNSPSNVYTATYTNPSGVKSVQPFTITVASTPIVPYLEVNGGPWQNVSSATVNYGDTVSFGPQPDNAGTWSWTGPNGFTSTARAISGLPLSLPTNVFTATYTNPAGVTSTQAFTITVNSTPIVPYLQVNGGAWQSVTSATVPFGSTVNLGPQPVSGGSWSWTGPNGFTSTARAINGIPLTSPTNVYIATYTNPAGVISTLVLTVTVSSTPIVPYIQVNGGAWQSVTTATVPYGSTVNLGPQPASGGSWSWIGPNGFSSNARAVFGIPLTSATSVFTASYTNPAGVTSSQTFTINIAPTPIVPYLEVGYGAWQSVTNIVVPFGSTVNLGPQPESGGSWTWTGPNGFTSNARAIYAIPLTSPTNVYTAAYTNAAGVTSTLAFTIVVAPTPIVPYIEVNGAAWQNLAAVIVTPGSTVNLGPQPVGGSWSWTGPNGFTSAARAINGIPLTSPTNVYTATYTNAAGVTSTQAFVIVVAPTPTVP